MEGSTHLDQLRVIFTSMFFRKISVRFFFYSCDISRLGFLFILAVSGIGPCGSLKEIGLHTLIGKDTIESYPFLVEVYQYRGGLCGFIYAQVMCSVSDHFLLPVESRHSCFAILSFFSSTMSTSKLPSPTMRIMDLTSKNVSHPNWMFFLYKGCFDHYVSPH